MNNNETVSMTKEELDALLKDAARRGAEEAMSILPKKTVSSSESKHCSPEDADALKFIATFPPNEYANSLCAFLTGSNVWGKIASFLTETMNPDNLRQKIDEYNAFESKIMPYYEYADDPNDQEGLSKEEQYHYQYKHEIYRALYLEKIRRFGLFGFNRGQIEIPLK